MILYRGFDRELASFKQVNIYCDGSRAPRDTDLENHNRADAWFEKKFSVRARSSTVICTTDGSQAAEYGFRYRVIPSEPYLILYSLGVRDFLEHESYVCPEYTIEQWLESKDFKCVNSLDLIEAGFMGEVMVWCSSYNVSRAF